MNLWRLLFGRRAAAAPPDQASLESAKPELEVSAPEAVVVPLAPVPEAVMAPEISVPEAVASAEGAGSAPEDTDVLPVPEPEISAVRLDEALRRLREENPAPSEEIPPAPSG
jgi:hypothetical protein